MSQTGRTPSPSAELFELMPHPSVAQLQAGLQRWANRWPDGLEVSELGKSAGGLPIIAAKVTDANVPGQGKQRVLFTACHAGDELNTCTGLLHFIKWLLSDDADAVRYRTLYEVMVVPCVDPDGYQANPPKNSTPSPYKDWKWDGPRESPSCKALFGMMETFQPEAHIDVHGLRFRQQYMWESTGISWDSALFRCHEHDLPRFIDEEVERHGYLITRGEQDAGRLTSPAPIAGAESHYYLQKSTSELLNAPCFSYNRYHSLGFIIEAGFDQSIVLRLKALLKAGEQRWRYQAYPGLPCDNLGIWGSIQLAAWGDNPADRRRSRVSLWHHAPYTSVGLAHPEYVGAVGGLLVLDPSKLARFGYEWSTQDNRWLCKSSLSQQIERLGEDERFNAAGLRDWYAARPRVPEWNATTDRFSVPDATHRDPVASLPEGGALVRLLIPYRDARIFDVSLDGHLCEPSRTDGYQITHGPGSVVQVAIPPHKLRGLHAVTCKVEPGEQRRSGFEERDWE